MKRRPTIEELRHQSERIQQAIDELVRFHRQTENPMVIQVLVKAMGDLQNKKEVFDIAIEVRT